MQRVIGWALAGVVFLSGCQSGPEQWGPFHGQVVDAETGEPIAGAHVVVQWYRDPPSLESSTRAYDGQEARTDANGRFLVARKTRWLTAWVKRPGVGVFAPGYVARRQKVSPPDGRPFVDPTVVEMSALRTREEQCGHLPGEPWVPEGAAPETTKAVREYVLALGCEGKH